MAKINVNYHLLHEAIDDFEMDRDLTAEKKQVLLQLILAAQGDYYPSILELEAFESNLKKLDSLKPNMKPWNRIFKQCEGFEAKYY